MPGRGNRLPTLDRLPDGRLYSSNRQDRTEQNRTGIKTVSFSSDEEGLRVSHENRPATLLLFFAPGALLASEAERIKEK